MLCVVLSSKFKSVGIDAKDLEEVQNIPRALMERFVNLTVEYDFWRIAIRRICLVTLRLLFLFLCDSKPTVSSSRQTQKPLRTKATS